MNRIEMEREHWVERYLAGHLSDADARRFEAFWVENPEVMRDLEASARFKTGLAGLRARGELDGVLRGAPGWPGRFRLLVLAACAVLVAVGVTTWRGAQSSAAVQLAASFARLPDATMLAGGPRHTLMRLRGASAVDAVLELPAAPAAIELRVLPEVAAVSETEGAPTRYVASLVAELATGAAREPAVVDGLVPGADGFVSVFVDSRTLAPGRYRLRLEAVPRAAADATGTAPTAPGAGFLLDVRVARGSAS